MRKAAKDWPRLNFVIYHSALRPCLEDPADELGRVREDRRHPLGRPTWRASAEKYGVNNVYARAGHHFATCAVTNPRFAAALVGQLVNLMGAERVVWGSDSVWYGSPQWQIEAMRRLEIPDDMMKKHEAGRPSSAAPTARSSGRSSA